MEIDPDIFLLFLDLDEVLMTRLNHGDSIESIVVIQPFVSIELAPFAGQILILTHRLRVEALQILKTLSGLEDIILGIVAADDIILAALSAGQVFSLLCRGIEKKLYIQVVKQKYGVPANRIAMLDDSLANINAFLGNGGGLGIHAPKPVFKDEKLFTFDLSAAVSVLHSFREKGVGKYSRISLSACREFLITELVHSKIVKAKSINCLRRIANKVRTIRL